jgi:hypothetical protein
MHDKSYPTRALAAYYRALARQHRTVLPLDDLPSWTFETTIAERASVAVCSRSRTLAVYRVKPGGYLSRLQRWSQALDRRLASHGPTLAKTAASRAAEAAQHRRMTDDYADNLGEIAGRLLAGI